MKRASQTAKQHAAPGDWVAHEPGAPGKILAIALSLPMVASILGEKQIDIDEVEVYQVPTCDPREFAGGGQLQIQSTAR
jgi:hypothetical protein